MLILARKIGEVIEIGGGAEDVVIRAGDPLRLVVVAQMGSVVKLGFDGTSEMPIYRGEIARKARAAKDAAHGGEIKDGAA
ncbi:carbon storage regulator [Symmachiella macrocystis]|uniref:Carbon storage regulator n=1 Tax=Symmachiella macrocystis TaxID=2527985 RepID=A0A5C6BLF0_9PLAN|nr:carbon storage regulator [Symmachiella macrocystis]TWU12878.1 carbon storage regulator [Symmachiella macrocystis]